MENRKAPRFKTRFDTLFGSGAREGTGVLADLSYSGARLEGVTHWPEVGAEVRLYVFIQPVAPFELIGRVTRASDTGFAVAFDLADPELCRLVDDVAAIVNQTP